MACWKMDVWDVLAEEEGDKRRNNLSGNQIRLLASLVGESVASKYAASYATSKAQKDKLPALPMFDQLPYQPGSRHKIGPFDDFEDFKVELHRFTVTEGFVQRDDGTTKPTSSLGSMCSFVAAVRVRGPLAFLTELSNPCLLPPSITFVDMPGEESEANYRATAAKKYVGSDAFSASSPRQLEATAPKRELGFQLLLQKADFCNGIGGQAAAVVDNMFAKCLEFVEEWPTKQDAGSRKKRDQYPGMLRQHLDDSANPGVRDLALARLQRCIIVLTFCDKVTPVEKSQIRVALASDLERRLGPLEDERLQNAAQAVPVFFTAMCGPEPSGVPELGAHLFSLYTRYFTRSCDAFLEKLQTTLSKSQLALASRIDTSEMALVNLYKSSLADWILAVQQLVSSEIQVIKKRLELGLPLPSSDELDRSFLEISTPPPKKINPNGNTVKKVLRLWISDPLLAPIAEIAKTRIRKFAEPETARSMAMFADNIDSLAVQLAKEDAKLLAKFPSGVPQSKAAHLRDTLRWLLTQRQNQLHTDAEELYEPKWRNHVQEAVGRINQLYRLAWQALESASKEKGKNGVEYLRNNRDRFDKVFADLCTTLNSELETIRARLLSDARRIQDTIERASAQQLDHNAAANRDLLAKVGQLAAAVAKIGPLRPEQQRVFKLPLARRDAQGTLKSSPQVVIKLVPQPGAGPVIQKEFQSKSLFETEKCILQHLSARYQDPPCARLVRDPPESDLILLLHRCEPFPPGLSCQELLRKLLECLCQVHDAGVIHTDIKLEHFCGPPARLIDWDHGQLLPPTGLVTVNIVGRETSNLPPELLEPGFAYPVNLAYSLDVWSAGCLALRYLKNGAALDIPRDEEQRRLCIRNVINEAPVGRVTRHQALPLFRLLADRMLCTAPAERWTAAKILEDSSFISGRINTEVEQHLRQLITESFGPLEANADLTSELAQLISHASADRSASSALRDLFRSSNLVGFVRRWWQLVEEIPGDADKNAISRVPEGYYHGLIHQTFRTVLSLAAGTRETGFYGSELRVGSRRIDSMLATPDGRVWLIEFKIDERRDAMQARNALRQIIWPYGNNRPAAANPYWHHALTKGFDYADVQLLAVVFPANKKWQPIVMHAPLSSLFDRPSLEDLFRRLQKDALKAALDQKLSVVHDCEKP